MDELSVKRFRRKTCKTNQSDLTSQWLCEKVPEITLIASSLWPVISCEADNQPIDNADSVTTTGGITISLLLGKKKFFKVELVSMGGSFFQHVLFTKSFITRET